jgi:hypothetical protein
VQGAAHGAADLHGTVRVQASQLYRVAALLPGPAKHSGMVNVGDCLVEIDGHQVHPARPDAVGDLMRGGMRVHACSAASSQAMRARGAHALRLTTACADALRPRAAPGRAGPVGTNVTLKLLRGREQVVLLLPPVVVHADFSHVSAAKGYQNI